MWHRFLFFFIHSRRSISIRVTGIYGLLSYPCIDHLYHVNDVEQQIVPSDIFDNFRMDSRKIDGTKRPSPWSSKSCILVSSSLNHDDHYHEDHEDDSCLEY